MLFNLDLNNFHPYTTPLDLDLNKKNKIFLSCFNKSYHQIGELQLLLQTYFQSFTEDSPVTLILYIASSQFDTESVLNIIDALNFDQERIPDLLLLEDGILESDYPALLASCDIYLSTVNSTEYLDQNIIAALAMQKQVICFETPHHSKNILQDVAYLIPPKSKELYCKTLQQIINTPPKKGMRDFILNSTKSSVPRNLVYVPQIAHIKSIRSNRPDLLNSIFVTDFFDTGTYLEEIKLDFLYLQSFITSQELRKNYKIACELCNSWHKPFSNQVIFYGIDIFETVKYEIMTPFLGALNAKTTFSKIIKDKNIGKIYFFDELKEYPHVHALGQPAPDTINAVLNWLTLDLSIPREILALPVDNVKDSEAQPPPKSTSLSAQEIFERIENKKKSAKRTVIGFGFRFDLAFLDQLPLKLWDDPDTLYIFIVNHPHHIETENCIVLDFELFLKQPFNSISFQEKLSIAWETFQTNNIDLYKNFSFIFKNTKLHFLFQYYFYVQVLYIQAMEAMRLIISTLKPDLCHFGLETPMNKCRIAMAKSMGTRTLTVSHSVMTAYMQHYLISVNTLADFLVVLGIKMKERLIGFGRPHDSIEAIGDITGGTREDAFMSRSKDATELKPENKFKDKLHEVSSIINNRPTILILTANIGKGIYQLNGDYLKVKTYFEQIKRIANRRPDLCFLIKTHPRYDYYAYYARLFKPCENIVLIGDSFVGDRQRGKDIFISDILPLCNLAIIGHLLSSSIFEVLNAQVPLLYIDNAYHGVNEVFDHPIRAFNDLTISNLEVLESKIDKILSDSSYKDLIISQGTHFLNDEKSYPPTQALENAQKLFKQQSQYASLKSNFSGEHDLNLFNKLVADFY